MNDYNSLVAELLRLGVYLQREGGRVTREFGLTQQHFVVLKTVQEQGPVSQKDIVSQLLYEKSNVSKAIASLERKGLIETQRDEKDSRRMLCKVSKAGLKTIEECMRVFDRSNSEWVEHIPEERLSLVLEVLRSLGRKE